MSIADLLFGIFVAVPMAALCIAVIVGTYAVPAFAIYAWIAARS